MRSQHRSVWWKVDATMLLSYEVQGEILLCHYPAPKLGADRLRHACRNRERQCCQLYRADPDLNYLRKSSLGEDEREMVSHGLFYPRDKTLPNNEMGNTRGELKTWYSNLLIKKIWHHAHSRLWHPLLPTPAMIGQLQSVCTEGMEREREVPCVSTFTHSHHPCHQNHHLLGAHPKWSQGIAGSLNLTYFC